MHSCHYVQYFFAHEEMIFECYANEMYIIIADISESITHSFRIFWKLPGIQGNI